MFAVGQLRFSAVRSALIAVVLTLVGVAIITVPWWLRLVRDLGDERRGRIRRRERAEIAAHLHDSVLQTLALIQRQADDPARCSGWRASQERQLRTWLYGPAGYARRGAPTARQSLAVASPRRPARSRTPTPSRSTPVIVGDVPLDDDLRALVRRPRGDGQRRQARRGREVSVYAEVEDGTVSVFVRDRGVGFDPAGVPDGPHGAWPSPSAARMDRHGGTATVRSAARRGHRDGAVGAGHRHCRPGQRIGPNGGHRDPGTPPEPGVATGEHRRASAAGTVGATADTKGSL